LTFPRLRHHRVVGLAEPTPTQREVSRRNVNPRVASPRHMVCWHSFALPSSLADDATAQPRAVSKEILRRIAVRIGSS
jgi:hypothetical protein